MTELTGVRIRQLALGAVVHFTDEQLAEAIALLESADKATSVFRY